MELFNTIFDAVQGNFALMISVLVIANMIFCVSLCVRKRYTLKQSVMLIGAEFLLISWVFHLFLGIAENGTGVRSVIQSFFLSVQSAVRMFLGDMSVDKIQQTMTALEWSEKTINGTLIGAAFLAAGAPILTFGYILSVMFETLRHYYLEKIFKKKNIYVFSELNEIATTIAKDLAKNNEAEKSGKKDSVFVFCDVFNEDNEATYNLFSQIRDLKTVTYKDDLLVVDERLSEKYKNDAKFEARYFLIGEDETENVSQAVALAEKYSQNDQLISQVKVYVHATNPANISILDSIVTDPFTREIEDGILDDFVGKINTSIGSETPEKADFAKLYECIRDNSDEVIDTINAQMKFVVKRIDPVKTLVWKTITDKENKLVPDSDTKKVSVLIAGVNKYGLEFLKMLVWYYQLPGTEGIDIHIADKRADLKSYLMANCPELVKYGAMGGDGEAKFGIHLHEGTDVLTYDYDRIFAENEDFKKLSAAFLCLGDDTLNIKGAVRTRSLLERHCVGNKTKVFAVVYDDRQAKNLNKNLVSPDMVEVEKGKPKVNKNYDIKFIGNMATLFSFKNLTAYIGSVGEMMKQTEDETESSAFFYHLQWTVCDAIKNKTQLTKDQIKGDLKKYISFEYYRNSSLATALHRKMLKDDYGIEPFVKTDVFEKKCEKGCTCESCKRKKLEHSRWTCYTRAEGFVQGSKSIMGKTHNDLVPFWELDIDVINKDF